MYLLVCTAGSLGVALLSNSCHGAITTDVMPQARCKMLLEHIPGVGLTKLYLKGTPSGPTASH